jgi:hypothetical protein
MRRRFVWDSKLKELVEVPIGRVPTIAAPYVHPDLPGYESPVTGLWVEGRKARREDLLRTNSRPWEGREQETKHAAKVRAEHEKKLDSLAERMAHRAWAEAPERVRKVFRYR